eukprot:TRINITY_DN903_c0_g3_i8.p1 TRINITY_DN903_c0_g3~~TRINITY_DN903_c0_g3_i8.p1  ORF type:complete len:729 (-),score=61.17 TRINITY_DN903_c0_g3_i8:1309-3495(-)
MLLLRNEGKVHSSIPTIPVSTRLESYPPSLYTQNHKLSGKILLINLPLQTYRREGVCTRQGIADKRISSPKKQALEFSRYRELRNTCVRVKLKLEKSQLKAATRLQVCLIYKLQWIKTPQTQLRKRQDFLVAQVSRQQQPQCMDNPYLLAMYQLQSSLPLQLVNNPGHAGPSIQSFQPSANPLLSNKEQLLRAVLQQQQQSLMQISQLQNHKNQILLQQQMLQQQQLFQTKQQQQFQQQDSPKEHNKDPWFKQQTQYQQKQLQQLQQPLTALNPFANANFLQNTAANNKNMNASSNKQETTAVAVNVFKSNGGSGRKDAHTGAGCRRSLALRNRMSDEVFYKIRSVILEQQLTFMQQPEHMESMEYMQSAQLKQKQMGMKVASMMEMYQSMGNLPAQLRAALGCQEREQNIGVKEATRQGQEPGYEQSMCKPKAVSVVAKHDFLMDKLQRVQQEYMREVQLQQQQQQQQQQQLQGQMTNQQFNSSQAFLALPQVLPDALNISSFPIASILSQQQPAQPSFSSQPQAQPLPLQCNPIPHPYAPSSKPSIPNRVAVLQQPNNLAALACQMYPSVAHLFGQSDMHAILANKQKQQQQQQQQGGIGVGSSVHNKWWLNSDILKSNQSICGMQGEVGSEVGATTSSQARKLWTDVLTEPGAHSQKDFFGRKPDTRSATYIRPRMMGSDRDSMYNLGRAESYQFKRQKLEQTSEVQKRMSQLQCNKPGNVASGI